MPEVPGEFAQLFFGRGVGAGRDGAELGAGGEKAGGLAVDQFHAVGFGDVDAADAVELDQFAFDHHLREADQQIENVEIALAQGDLKGLHVEPVAGENAGVIAPLHVGGRTAAAGLGDVDDVVMNERRGVDHFDHGAQLDRGLATRSLRRRRKRAQSSSSAGRRRLPPLCCR